MEPIDEDVFIGKFQPSELKIASDFLTNWFPFLSKGLCKDCIHFLSNRIHSLAPEHCSDIEKVIREDKAGSDSIVENMESEKFCDFHSLSSLKAGDIQFRSFFDSYKNTLSSQSTVSEITSNRMSWADMTQKDGFEDEEQKESELDMQSVDASTSVGYSTMIPAKCKLSREERERFRFMNVKKMKVFTCFRKLMERWLISLKDLNYILVLLAQRNRKRLLSISMRYKRKVHNLHMINILTFVMLSLGGLLERTYSAPQKWMRGRGRVTIQFGCCYNYVTDKAGNPSGILQQEDVDPIPSLFKVTIRRLISWHVRPPTCVPDSCIVNIYEEGDCIPLHIDHHDFLRPFCTISFLSECDILFGTNFKIVGPGEISGSCSIPLPVGSVLVLKGNGADVAKHCIPAVPRKRISITFRKMDQSKTPVGFIPEPDLQEIKPLPYKPITVATTISSSTSSNEENGARAVHIEGSKHRKSRDYRFEGREWSSSS